MNPPAEYLKYFVEGGSIEGALSVEPWWFQLWPPDELVEWNLGYHVPEYAPGFLGFGSSGGGEMLAFDVNGRIIMIPFIVLSPDDAIVVADSWSDFVTKIEEK